MLVCMNPLDGSDEGEYEIKATKTQKAKEKPKGRKKAQFQIIRLNIYTIIGPKSFSNWKNLCKKLEINSNPVIDEEQFPKHTKDSEDVEVCTINLKKTILRREGVCKDAFGTGNEHARSYYVMAILEEVMEYFDLKKFAICFERLLGSDDTWGLVEFVLTARNADDSPVGFVVELKAEEFDQGRAQLYMQLLAAHEENIEAGAEFKIMGAITTAKSWVFVIYDGEKFYESDMITVGASPKFTNLDVVVDWLVSVLEYISDE